MLLVRFLMSPSLFCPSFITPSGQCLEDNANGDNDGGNHIHRDDDDESNGDVT